MQLPKTPSIDAYAHVPPEARLLDLLDALAQAVEEVRAEAARLATDPTADAEALREASQRRDQLVIETGYTALRCPTLIRDLERALEHGAAGGAGRGGEVRGRAGAAPHPGDRDDAAARREAATETPPRDRDEAAPSRAEDLRATDPVGPGAPGTASQLARAPASRTDARPPAPPQPAATPTTDRPESSRRSSPPAPPQAAATPRTDRPESSRRSSPPAPPQAAAAPAAPPPSTDSLAALRDKYTRDRSPSPTPVVRIAVQTSADELQPLAEAWGLPLPVVDVEAAIAALHRGARTLDRWLEQPRDRQQRLLAWVVARARDVQETSGSTERLDGLFGRLTAWSEEHRPGFVHGLSRDHRPRRTTWYDDAKHAWQKLGLKLPALSAPDGQDLDALRAAVSAEGNDEALRQLVAMVRRFHDDTTIAPILVGHGARLVGDDALIPLLRRVRKLEKKRRKQEGSTVGRAKGTRAGGEGAEAPANIPPTDPLVPEDWPGFALTRGARALVVGGDRGARLKRQLCAELGLAKVDVVTGHKPRQVQSAAQRIQAGTYDIVFILKRFNAHKTTDRLLRDRLPESTRLLQIENSAGMQQFVRAVEEGVG